MKLIIVGKRVTYKDEGYNTLTRIWINNCQET